MIHKRTSKRLAMLVLAGHLAALVAGLAYTWTQWADSAAQQAAVEQSRETLARLDRRLASGPASPAGVSGPPAADPFLQGASASIAGADLQERVGGAIRKVAGTVTSSQIDTSASAGSTPAMVQLTVSCELPDTALQELLYTLENGSPALFLDQLSVQSVPREGGEPGAGLLGPLKVSMTISAYRSTGGKS